MLRRTFLHIPGVGARTEQNLWKKGCTDWKIWLADPKGFSLGTADVGRAKEILVESEKALIEGRHQFFAQNLSAKDAWRAYPHFKDSTCYLDIETDGGQSPSSITIIGLFDGKEFHVFRKGDNLDNFRDRISHFSQVVTYYGSGFDLPVLTKKYGPIFDQIHFDLCPAFQKLDFVGGLKKLEKQFGIERSPDTVDLRGRDAIDLWRKFSKLGQQAALDLLIRYNEEDVVSLPLLAEKAYTGLEELTLHGKSETVRPQA